MLLFKRLCDICDGENKSIGRICSKCRNAVENHTKLRKCLKCGRLIPINSESICHECIRDNYHFDIAISVYPYKNDFKEALLRFKFKGEFFRVKAFSKLMTEALKKYKIQVDYMVPVPTKLNKLAEKGYNPPLEMGYLMSRPLGVKIIPQGLLKTGKTAQQSTLNEAERRKNVKDAYAVNKIHTGKFKGKQILLIDDVLTTGSTVSECAKILKEAGAAAVYVVTFLIAE